MPGICAERFLGGLRRAPPHWNKRKKKGRPKAPQGESERMPTYIFSGELMPSRPRETSSTMRVASTKAKRAA